MINSSVLYPITLILDLLAIMLMIYCLWLVVSLRKQIVGGIIGSKWNILTGLVSMFALTFDESRAMTVKEQGR
jgi:steroid 5-alpha reductase family enzyme